MTSSLKPYQIIIMAAGAVVFVFSFLDWFTFEGFGGENAWSSGLLPLATLVPLFGAAMAVVVALDAFADVNLPDEVATFSWPQIHLVLSGYSVLIMFHYLVVEKGGLSFGIGFWFSLVGSIGLVVGAVMMRQDDSGGAAPAGPTGPPQSF